MITIGAALCGERAQFRLFHPGVLGALIARG